MANRGIVFSEDTLTPNIQRMAEALPDVATDIVDQYRPIVEQTAQNNAPWTDRSGNARKELSAVTEHTLKSHSIILQHGVGYGIYLETRWEGKFAIIEPTIRASGPALLEHFSGLFQKLI